MARRDSVWQIRYGTYIETSSDGGYDILVNGINRYINFNDVSGFSGYGFRDNAGVMEYKNDGGTRSIFSGGGGGGTPGGSNTQVQYNNAGAFGGISGATTNGTALTFTSGNLKVSDVQASGSGGVEIKNSAGTNVIIAGAGGGTGITLVGNTNIGDSGVDYHQLVGGTGTISDTATGASANININLVPKGTGRVQAGGVTVPTISSSDALTNKTINLSSNTLTGTIAQFNTALSDGDFATGGGTATGTNTGDQTITLTSDVTGSGTGSFATTIANDAVTYAKMQNASAGNVVLARAAATSGDYSEVAIGTSQLFGRGSTGDVAPITLGFNLSMSGTTLNATGGGGGGQPYTALSSDTTITQGNVYGVTASTANINLTLSDGTTAGQTLTVKKLDSTDYSIYINNANIEGDTSVELTMEDESIDLYRTGTAFIIK